MAVKIIDYRKRENKDGEEFFALIIEGGLEMVKSRITGRYYIIDIIKLIYAQHY